MNTSKHKQRGFLFKGCALLLVCSFWINAGISLGYCQEESTVAQFSIVTMQEGQTLEDLARKYQTTAQQIRLDNPAVNLQPGGTVTIREQFNKASTVTIEIPVAVEALSRGTQQIWNWPAHARISSDYGWRNGEFHHGIDLAIPHGTSVLAAREGKVVKARWMDIYGLTILLDHGNGVESLYAHNQKLLVEPGDWVKQGEAIAISGDTGRSTGPHLHFEIRLQKKTIDPLPYLPRIN
ncbi:peptidoglycan DD-metalloendopeptidase family protein [Desulfitobacterium sp. THU1]|uniref:M23 family metallopeptidase n=1 Tax=Desulfitobacterium sp. THU1 TaxID=3138072 RepID=UPI00311FCA01